MTCTIPHPPQRADCNVAVPVIGTSDGLPICGLGTVGILAMGIENGLIAPTASGHLSVDAPAGKIEVSCRRDGRLAEAMRLTSVRSALPAEGLTADVPGLGGVAVDVARGGNVCAIVEPQGNSRDMADFTACALIRHPPRPRAALNAAYDFVHPDRPAIGGLSHILWPAPPIAPGARACKAAYDRDKAIERSPCGTGAAARMAQDVTRGRLSLGGHFGTPPSSVRTSRAVSRPQRPSRNEPRSSLPMQAGHA